MGANRFAWLVAVVTLTGTAALAQTGGAMARFAGTWVGTQAWAIEDPPPGARQDQPVTLTIDVKDGKLTGSMKPFMGDEQGATITGSRLEGDALHATAVVGRVGGRRGGNPASQPRVDFVFSNEGLLVTGTADVFMGDVPWTRFRYTLERKRSRY
jgi:hypothetical protein